MQCPDSNRLMELWKGAAKTKTGEPGVTSLGFYDVFHDEIVILKAVEGMRIRGDMRGFHEVPHFVPGGLLRGGGGIQGCNFSWTHFGDSSWIQSCGGSTIHQ
jgi:hypothetical protein